MPENLTHGYKKKIIKKQQKTVFLCLKIQPGRSKELIFLINNVLEEILIYHLRLKENFFFEKKSFKKLQVLTL